jgi:uncharacterized membrane protein
MNLLRRRAEVRPAGAIAAAAVLCAACVITLPAANPARAIAGLTLVLLLPGAALLGALSPATPPTVLERVLWRVGLSIAVTILLTLALDAAGLAVELRSWACALTVVTLVACGAWARQSRGTERMARTWRPRLPSTGRIAALALAALLCGGAVLVTARSVQRTAAASHFTQLWILPPSATGKAATIGVANHEGEAQHYILTASRRGRALLRLPELTVSAGATWTRQLAPPIGGGRVDVTLRRVGQRGVVYRHVYVWLRSAGSR